MKYCKNLKSGFYASPCPVHSYQIYLSEISFPSVHCLILNLSIKLCNNFNESFEKIGLVKHQCVNKQGLVKKIEELMTFWEPKPSFFFSPLSTIWEHGSVSYSWTQINPWGLSVQLKKIRYMHFFLPQISIMLWWNIIFTIQSMA